MAENHIKTDSIALQLQAECWYEQEGLISEYKNRGQRKPGKRRSDRLPCLDNAALVQGGYNMHPQPPSQNEKCLFYLMTFGLSTAGGWHPTIFGSMQLMPSARNSHQRRVTVPSNPR